MTEPQTTDPGGVKMRMTREWLILANLGILESPGDTYKSAALLQVKMELRRLRVMLGEAGIDDGWQDWLE